MLLSACMIVKNEESFLEGSLISLKDLVDEIVIVDTGSTDQTVEIARSHGAVVHHSPWRDDFAQARNVAIDKAQGDWILRIDADERVKPFSRAALEKLLLEPSVIAYSCPVHYLRGWTPFSTLHLYRNHPEVRYSGVIHESIDDQVERIALRDGLTIESCGMTIEHLGYVNDGTAKFKRDLPYLLREVDREPDNALSWSRLGLLYYNTGEHKAALEACEKAIALVRKKESPQAKLVYPYFLMIHFRFSKGLDPGPLLAEGLELFPDDLSLVYFKGWDYLQTGFVGQAAAIFTELVKMGADRDDSPPAPHELAILGEYAWAALGDCNFKMGNYAKAGHCFDQAGRHLVENNEYRVKGELCRIMQERQDRQ